MFALQRCLHTVLRVWGKSDPIGMPLSPSWPYQYRLKIYLDKSNPMGMASWMFRPHPFFDFFLPEPADASWTTSTVHVRLHCIPEQTTYWSFTTLRVTPMPRTPGYQRIQTTLYSLQQADIVCRSKEMPLDSHLETPVLYQSSHCLDLHLCRVNGAHCF